MSRCRRHSHRGTYAYTLYTYIRWLTYVRHTHNGIEKIDVCSNSRAVAKISWRGDRTSAEIRRRLFALSRYRLGACALRYINNIYNTMCDCTASTTRTTMTVVFLFFGLFWHLTSQYGVLVTDENPQFFAVILAGFALAIPQSRASYSDSVFWIPLAQEFDVWRGLGLIAIILEFNAR